MNLDVGLHPSINTQLGRLIEAAFKWRPRWLHWLNYRWMSVTGEKRRIRKEVQLRMSLQYEQIRDLEHVRGRVRVRREEKKRELKLVRRRQQLIRREEFRFARSKGLRIYVDPYRVSSLVTPHEYRIRRKIDQRRRKRHGERNRWVARLVVWAVVLASLAAVTVGGMRFISSP